MISNTQLKIAKYGYIILSALFCALGITLIAVPGFSPSNLCLMGGVLLILFGCIKIIGYASKDLYRLAFQFDLALGILLIALGAILIFRTDNMMHPICALLGIFILADALLKVQIAIDSKDFGIHKWWLIMAAALITGAVGFLLVFRLFEKPRLAMILLGASLISEGVLNTITILSAVRIIRQQIPAPTMDTLES